MDMGSSPPSPPPAPPPVCDGRRGLDGDEERVRSRAELARKEEWPRRDSAFMGSWRADEVSFGLRYTGRENMGTHCVFDPDHPAPTDDFTIFAHRAHRVRMVPVPNPEAVDDFCVRVRVGAVPEMFEVFGGDAVSVGGVAEDDNVDGFGGGVGSGRSRLRLGVGVGG